MAQDSKSAQFGIGKHILVTGGAGYIGSHTVIQLLDEGYDVTIIDNFVNSSPESLKRIPKLTKGGRTPAFKQVDLCDREALEAVFKAESKPFDACIHFAGLKAVGESVSIPLRYYQNNLTGTLNLFELMEKYNCLRIVFSSSATVYGIPEKVPLDEKSPLSVTNPYGRTKLMIEDVLRDMAVAPNSKWQIAILRYFNPVGAHESGLIGEDPAGIPNNLSPYIQQVAIGRREFLSIFGDDYPTVDGTGVRDYIHVQDLASGHLAALRYSVFSAPSISTSRCDVYNLGTGSGISVKQLAAAFEKASGRKIPFKIVGRRPGDVASCYADAAKAQKELHWKATRTVDQACLDGMRWQAMNPNGFKSAPVSAAQQQIFDEILDRINKATAPK